eukprot:1248652-Amphidinium_carterae.1
MAMLADSGEASRMMNADTQSSDPSCEAWGFYEAHACAHHSKQPWLRLEHSLLSNSLMTHETHHMLHERYTVPPHLQSLGLEPTRYRQKRFQKRPVVNETAGPPLLLNIGAQGKE